MKKIGVRELRQRASEFLAEVERGKTLEVTAHGRPVARLVPAQGRDRRDLLAAGGRIRPAEGDLLDLGAPLTARTRVPKPSHRLTRMRATER
jgi:prevent-host-death family protein